MSVFLHYKYLDMNTYLTHGLLALLIIASTVIIVSYDGNGSSQLVQTANNQQLLTNTISVQWDGEVRVSPDAFVINVAVRELADTTRLAQENANKKTSDIMKSLETLWIEKKNIKTQNMSVYPEYDYSDGWRKVLWYRANQDLTISVVGENFTVRGGEVVDAMTNIDGVLLNNTSFELRDRETAMEKARALAYEKAKKKADQLASLAWSKVVDVLSLADSNISFSPAPMMLRNAAMSDMVETQSIWWSSISEGDMVVTVSIDAMFVMN